MADIFITVLKTAVQQMTQMKNTKKLFAKNIFLLLLYHSVGLT